MNAQLSQRGLRKRRGWAIAPADVRTLSRSARQLAKSSATRIARPQVAECLRRLKLVMSFERVCKLMMGDLLVELVDGHGLRAIDIARETGYRPADLSEMLKTARIFPVGERATDIGYNQFLLATRMLAKFPELEFSPQRALGEILDRRFTQHRDVTRHFAALARQRSGRQLLLPDTSDQTSLVDQAHHCRFQDLLPRFPDASIRILHIDPPYVYQHGTYRSRSAREQHCDSDDAVSAIQVVIDLLQDWQVKLAPGGVGLLWQPWGTLAIPIMQAVEKFGLALHGPIVWDKGRPQPGRFDSPYSPQGEMLWVLYRPGDHIENFDGSSRESILRFAPVSVPSRAHRQAHAFEKPVELCEFLVRKHSQPGDVIFDACGCTGSMSIAAINCDRGWVYAESHQDNHRMGAARIEHHIAKLKVNRSRIASRRLKNLRADDVSSHFFIE